MRPASFELVDGQFVFPLRSTVERIRRKLHDLDPYKTIDYDPARKDYYIHTIHVGQPDHMQEYGPYNYKYLIALADMLNVWTIVERTYQPKSIRAEYGIIHEQEPLPSSLQFTTITVGLRAVYGQLDEKAVARARCQGIMANPMINMAVKLKIAADMQKAHGWSVIPPTVDLVTSTVIETEPRLEETTSVP